MFSRSIVHGCSLRIIVVLSIAVSTVLERTRIGPLGNDAGPLIGIFAGPCVSSIGPVLRVKT